MNLYLNRSIIEKLPADHFGETTKEVVQLITNGQCCGIYGIPGYGMDFFAKQIQEFLIRDYPDYKTVFLKLNLGNRKTDSLKKELSRVTSLKSLDDASLAEYLQNNKIIIILSEVYSPNYKRLFGYISTLRSINPTNFTVLTVANYTLEKDSRDYLRFGSNLFTPLKRIRNFSLTGVKRIIKLNNEEHNWNIPLKYSKRILFLSGGNPALVNSICMTIYYEGEIFLRYPKKLIKFEPINYRLSQITKLITELTIEEQIQIGIINNNGTIFSDLLVEYLKQHELQGLDRLFPDLTKTDRKIFTLLVQNQGKILDKEQISIILDQKADADSQWAIYKAVERVREKIRDRYTIKTLKGRGWRMEILEKS